MNQNSDWYKPKIDISVITNNRPNSLSRLMDSLSNADYYGDEVNLILNLEQTSDLQTRKLCTNYQWNQGAKIIRQRIIHAGLLPAVIESWYPSSPHDSYGVLLEDDVEVSSQFYGHDPITSPYLSPIPCCWGALFFPESWIGFQHFLSLRLSDSLKPKLRLEGSAILSPIRSTRWPKSWKKYLIEWVYLRGEVMLYPNFRNVEGESESLSTNHLEQGTHIHDQVEEEVKKTFEVKLMKSNRSLLNGIGIENQSLPKLSNLMCVDLWGEITNLIELLQRGWIGANTLGLCDDDDDENENDQLIGLNKLICRSS
ncbi:hypothetical protein DFH28DRAFT_1058746 [Melampsora americana]|nr:hypothetical protein DFH28DRAFT_1058746 [Melampsora americana]